MHRPKLPKYKPSTLKQKICLIKEANKFTCSNTKLAEKHQGPISTLCTILKNQARIIEVHSRTYSAKRSRIRFTTYPDVGAALITWLQNDTAAHLPVESTISREKPNNLALKLGHEEFRCSSGWFSHFKERNNLTFLTVSDESCSTDKTVVEDWIKHTLAPLLSKYSADDVYNLDEAALFYKNLPTKKFAAKDTDVKGWKQPKDRITVMFGVNMTGKHKLAFLVLGKSEKPRCSKTLGFHQPINELIYRRNKRAWVTAIIFEE
uniref:Putative tigger transposase n=1 Tax=Ixodes ricinus TaxID=34613 RepID=A0A6B0V5Z1_IXORI